MIEIISILKRISLFSNNPLHGAVSHLPANVLPSGYFNLAESGLYRNQDSVFGKSRWFATVSKYLDWLHDQIPSFLCASLQNDRLKIATFFCKIKSCLSCVSVLHPLLHNDSHASDIISYPFMIFIGLQLETVIPWAISILFSFCSILISIDLSFQTNNPLSINANGR